LLGGVLPHRLPGGGALPDELRRALPQLGGETMVLRLGAGRRRLALLQVLAAELAALRVERESDERLRAASGRSQERPDQRRAEPPQPGLITREGAPEP